MGPEYFWMGGMWIFPIFMLIVFFVCLYLFFGRGNRPPWIDQRGYASYGKAPETALDILKQRYARGEISSDEFEQIKKDIQS